MLNEEYIIVKKLICLFLAALLVCSIPFAFAEDDFVIFDDEEEEAGFSDGADESLEEIELVPYDYDDITVGNPTPLNGQFFTDLWGNATSDTDVRHLVTGYNLAIWDGELSVFRFDHSVVSGALVRDDKDGNRSYLITLYSDLFYSDGTPVTARDYAFTVLFECNPVISELGGHPAVYDYLVGYEDYAAGITPYIAGLRIPADNMIEFTVKKEALPYFYELSRLAFYPYPIHAIAPGCAVYDEGKGAFIGSSDMNAAVPFTADLLRGTILDPAAGYLSHPNPVSGPYRLLSYDGQNAVFEINPYYKGNDAGEKPRIKRLTYTVADNPTMIRELGEGKFALLNKVTYAPAITEGLQLSARNPQYTRSTYPRIGLTYLFFNPDSPLIQDLEVRQAVALCFDKQAFIRDYVGAFGLEMQGLYGLGHWMFNAVSGTLPFPDTRPENPTREEEEAYQKASDEWDELSLDGLTQYEMDPEEAVRLLEEAGWTLNERGESFDPQVDKVRCKMSDTGLLRLELTLAYQPRADVEQAFENHLTDILAQAGIGLSVVPLEFESIVEAHNEHVFDGLDIIYFGDNFNISFDPALFFWKDDASGEPMRAVYEELFALSEDMDHTEPRDVLGYMQKWVRFQERLTELLPLIPVYSNVYFDFYTKELDEYWIEEHISWGKAIVPARMRSIRSDNEEDNTKIEAELSYANGEAELDISSMLERTAREKTDYSAGALSRFPEYVRRQVPSEYKTIYEIVAGNLNTKLDEKTRTLTTKYSFQTRYPAGETVYVLFGIPGNGSDVEWLVQKGTGASDGGVLVTIDREQWEKLLGKTFAIVVVSR